MNELSFDDTFGLILTAYTDRCPPLLHEFPWRLVTLSTGTTTSALGVGTRWGKHFKVTRCAKEFCDLPKGSYSLAFQHVHFVQPFHVILAE